MSYLNVSYVSLERKRPLVPTRAPHPRIGTGASLARSQRGPAPRPAPPPLEIPAIWEPLRSRLRAAPNPGSGGCQNSELSDAKAPLGVPIRSLIFLCSSAELAPSPVRFLEG